MGWYSSISLLTFYLPPSSLSSRFLREDRAPASLLLSMQTQAHLRYRSGALGHPARRGKGSSGGTGLSPGFVPGGNGRPRECWSMQGRMWAGAASPLASAMPATASQPPAVLLQRGGDRSLALCAWRLNGNQHLGWDFFHGSSGENGQLHPLHAFGKHIWVKVTDLCVGGKGQGVPRGGWESVTV